MRESIDRLLGDAEIDACESLLVELDTKWHPRPTDHMSADRLVRCGMAEYFGLTVVKRNKTHIVEPEDLKVTTKWHGENTGVHYDEKRWGHPVLSALVKQNAVPTSWWDGAQWLHCPQAIIMAPEFIRLTPDGLRWKGASFTPDNYRGFVLQLHVHAGLPIQVMAAFVLEQLRASFEQTASNTGTVSESARVSEVDANTPEAWKERRIRHKESVPDQMMLLFRRDETIAAETSSAIALMLGCNESAVRKKGNAIWQLFQKVREERKQARKNPTPFDPSTVDLPVDE